MTTLDSTYIEICRKLGADPNIQFVEVEPDGSIGFSSGKPDEVRWLLRRVHETGMKPSKSLVRTVDEIDLGGNSFANQYK